MSDENKLIANKLKSLLKEYGHDVPQGHIYEILSKLAGFNSWNVANAKKADFEKLFLHQINDKLKLSEKVNILYKTFWENDALSENALMGAKIENGEVAFLNNINLYYKSNSLFVGGMGSGKSVAQVSTVLSYIKTHAKNSLVFVVDPIKSAADYNNLFKLAKVIPVINDQEKINKLINLLYEEALSRREKFIESKAETFIQYEKKTGKTLDRCILVIEELSVILSNLDYENNCNTEESPAYKLKMILKVGRSFGITIIAANQSGSLSNIPKHILMYFANIHAFRMSQSESNYLIGNTNAYLIKDGGFSVDTEGNYYQFPFFSSEDQIKVLKNLNENIINCFVINKDNMLK